MKIAKKKEKKKERKSIQKEQVVSGGE